MPATETPLVLSLANPANSVFTQQAAVTWNLVGNELHIKFDVNIPVQHEKSVLSKGQYPFQFDVTEVFIAVNDPKEKDTAYYEFELTPNNQVYNVLIKTKNGKRKDTVSPPVTATAMAERTEQKWSGSFIISLETLGWKGDPSFLRGNFYAILGKPSQKSYWAAFPLGSPFTFHQPKKFKPFFSCD